MKWVESCYRLDNPIQKNVQWFWVGFLDGSYGDGFWRPRPDNGQLPTTQIFELLRKYL